MARPNTTREEVMDKKARQHFEAFDASQVNDPSGELYGQRKASDGGVRESYFEAGVRYGVTVDSGEKVRTWNDPNGPDVVFMVYRGRQINLSARTAKGDGYVTMNTFLDTFGHNVLRGKSEAVLGREIMKCAMLGLKVTVERGEDWQ